MLRFRIAFVSSAVTFAATVLPAETSARTIVLSLDAWNQAIASGFNDTPVVQRPLRIVDAEFHDPAGDGFPYRHPSEQVFVSFDTFGPRDQLASRLQADLPWPAEGGLPVGMAGDDLVGLFKCSALYSPCLGLTRAELFFPEPIWGLAGLLEYSFGEAPDGGRPVEDAMLIEPFRSGWRQATETGIPLPPFAVGGQWQTFFGVLVFDEPIESLILEWRPQGFDGGTGFRLRQARMLVADDGGAGGFDEPIGVPEPAALALFALALFGLAATRLPVPLRVRPGSPT